MNNRVHEALDGDLDPDRLSPEERREMEILAAVSTKAATHVRRVRSPGCSDGVLSELDRRGGSRPEGRSTGWLRHLWEPRTLAIRPVWGLLAAAALAAVILVPSTEGPGEEQLTPHPEGVTVFVQFRLHAPEASEVRLAGSFTNWEPTHELHPTGDGAWAVMVPMNPGIHDYAFVVDGTDWTPDPSAPRVDDGFGGENSRLALLLVNGTRES